MITEFTLNIATGNSAFQDGDCGIELARILRKLANRVEKETGPVMVYNPLTVTDSNGNKVGRLMLDHQDSE